MSCHPSHGQTGKDTRSVRKIHHWAPFQAPWEEETPGFEQVKVEVVTPTEPPAPQGGGPDTRVTCFRCHNDTYRVVDHKTEEEVLAQLPTEKYRRSKGRGDAEAADNILMLVCPKCEDRVQMKQSVIERLRQ